MKKSILCKCGFHNFKTIKRVRCKVHVQGSLGIVKTVKGEALFQACCKDGCNIVRGMVDTGFHKEEMSIGYLARTVINGKPSQAKDLDLLRWAKM